MTQWDAAQYLKFEDERTRPCRDLANSIQVSDVHRVIDLGCGPGTSTRILRERWPNAVVIGLDNSAEMIGKARIAEPLQSWVLGEIAEWEGESVDVVFSNAALHWVPNHDALFPWLLSRATVAFAVQIPDQVNAPSHRLVREIASSAAWQRSFQKLPQWYGRDLDFYYDLLSPHATRLDMWSTEYIHSMANVEAIAEWYKGSGLRPYLDALRTSEERDRFVAEYIAGLREMYKPQPDGRILFPFRRMFVVAYK